MKRIVLLISILFTALALVSCLDAELEHIESDEIRVIVQPTCATEGRGQVLCSVCDTVMREVVIPATQDHNAVDLPAVDATCKEKGLTKGEKCSDCGKILVEQQEIPVLAHVYDDKYDESCNECGHIRDAECAHKEIEVIKGKDATCTEIGYTDGEKCKKCGEILTAQKVIEKKKHDYSEAVTHPTCTEKGYTTYTCECGDSYVGDYVDATGHSYQGITCAVCGETHPNAENYEGKVISILGDSISTFAGYIPVADGFNLEHLARYPQDNLLTDVNETWWMQIVNQLDAKLGINDSWRGTQVINTITGNSGVYGENTAMASLTRIQNLGSNGTPDVILFFGGTNDIGGKKTLGSFNPATAPTEVDLTSVKWNTVADAYVTAIMRMQHFYPDSQIIAMLPTYTSSYYTNAKLAQYNTVFSAICEHYGITYIDLRDCGISTADLPDGIHPDANGMDYITAAVLDTLLNNVKIESGENMVHSVTHKLNGAESSLGYYKGVTHGKSFATTISGEDVTVSVTMGGVDITNTAYANGVVSVSSVTGDIIITAQGRVKSVYEDHLQQLPENLCCSTNLWTSLVPENTYYTGSAWGNVSGNSVYSITIPISAGDQIWATSFQKSGINGGSRNGIRLTWFDKNGVLKSVSPDSVYAEFAANGYLAAPEGAVAVNVVMWNGQKSHEVYVLNRAHTYENGICTGCGEKLSFEGKTISILGDSISTYTGVSNNAAVNITLKGGAIYYNAGTLGVYRADTWWQQTIDALGMELLVNNSWSGSTVLHTRSGTAGAYVDRCVQLHNTAGDEPDVIVVFLGTNDFSYYQSALGTANIDYFKLITDNGDGTYTYATPKTTCEAYAVMLHKMINRYPNAEVYCMNLLPRRNPDHDGKDVVPAPTQFNEELAKVISHFGCTVVDLENCGITPSPENFDIYITDQRVHPGPLGMDKMTQALIDAMMGKKNATFTVSQNLVNVTANASEDIVLAGQSFKVVLTPAAGFEKLTVTVTMGGKDVTASVYSNGKVDIPAVTGDVVITASATVDDIPNNYCWEISGNNFVNVVKNDLSANAITKKAGSITDGVIKSAYFQLEKPVVLRHNLPWIVEWRVSGTNWTGMLLSGNVNSSAAGNSYLFKTTQNTGFIGFGEWMSGTFHNYGIALASQGVDINAEHTYRLENRIMSDGSNMVYLMVDGKDYGPMNHYYIGGNSNQGKQVDWLNGRDFCFFYIGSNGHPINNCQLDYLSVTECVHTYQNGICIGCGKSE